MKTIVHITTSLRIGGAEAVLTDLLQQKNDYCHIVLYLYDGPHRQRLEQQGIATHCISGWVYTYDPTLWIRVCWYMCIYRPTILHSWLWSSHVIAALFSFCLRIPLVVAVHSPVNQTLQATHSTWRLWVDRWMYLQATRIVAVSAAIAQQLKERYPSYHDKIQCIPNGITSPKSVVDTASHSYGCVIGMVGRFIPLKNHALLLHAVAPLCARYSELHILLVGFGPLENSLRLLTEELGIAAYVSFVLSTQAANLLSQMDIYVSTSHTEGLSIALLEAMAAGKAIVVATFDQQHEVITHGLDGMLVQPDEASVRDALEYYITNCHVRQHVGLQAQHTVQHRFSAAVMRAKYQQMYNSLAK